jgi:hypothetical protein
MADDLVKALEEMDASAKQAHRPWDDETFPHLFDALPIIDAIPALIAYVKAADRVNDSCASVCEGESYDHPETDDYDSARANLARALEGEK